MEKKRRKIIHSGTQKASWQRLLHSGLDKISSATEKFGLIYLVIALGLIAVVLLISYCTIPVEIRDVFTPVVGGLFSLVIIPFILEERKHSREIKEKSFERNADLYRDYLVIAVGISQEDDTDSSKCDYYRNLLKKYTEKHYPDMCMQFPSDLYWQIHTVARYLEKKEMGVAKYYAEKSISLICSQAGMGKTACNSQRLRGFYSQNGKVSK